jgi:site-specific recombinase XerD
MHHTALFLRESHMTPNTRATYSAGLKAFDEAGFVINQNCIRDFYRHLATVKSVGRDGRARLLSTATVAAYIAALRKCIVWLEANDHISAEVVGKAERRWSAEHKPRYKTQSDVRRPNPLLYTAIDYYDTLPLPDDKEERLIILRNRALMWSLWDTAGRVSECLQLTRANTKDGTQEMVSIVGKGDRRRTIRLGAESMRAIREYVAERDDAKKPIFIPHKHPGHATEALSRVGAWRIVKAAAQAVGLDGNIGPHAIRHAKAEMMANEGMPMHLIQRVLGHESMSTTVRSYAIVSDKRAYEAMDEYTIDPLKVKR